MMSRGYLMLRASLQKQSSEPQVPHLLPSSVPQLPYLLQSSEPQLPHLLPKSASMRKVQSWLSEQASDFSSICENSQSEESSSTSVNPNLHRFYKDNLKSHRQSSEVSGCWPLDSSSVEEGAENRHLPSICERKIGETREYDESVESSPNQNYLKSQNAEQTAHNDINMLHQSMSVREDSEKSATAAQDKISSEISDTDGNEVQDLESLNPDFSGRQVEHTAENPHLPSICEHKIGETRVYDDSVESSPNQDYLKSQNTEQTAHNDINIFHQSISVRENSEKLATAAQDKISSEISDTNENEVQDSEFLNPDFSGRQAEHTDDMMLQNRELASSKTDLPKESFADKIPVSIKKKKPGFSSKASVNEEYVKEAETVDETVDHASPGTSSKAQEPATTTAAHKKKPTKSKRIIHHMRPGVKFKCDEDNLSDSSSEVMHGNDAEDSETTDIAEDEELNSRNKMVSSRKQSIASTGLNPFPSARNTSKILVRAIVLRRGRRVFDKRQACGECGQSVLQLSRHLKRHHSDVADVAEVLCTRDVKRRKFLYRKIKNIGNFKHNAKVMQDQEGELIVARRSKKRLSVDQYLPCPHCLVFYDSDQLWKHCKKCPFQESPDTDDSQKRHSVTINARLLLAGAQESEDVDISDDVRNNLLAHMREDSIKREIRCDKLIILFGKVLLRKIGSVRKTEIVQRMRLLANLKVQMNRLLQQPISLMEAINGQYFDKIVEGVHNLCEPEIDERSRTLFKKPSLGLRLGHSLLKCAHIKRGMAIRLNDDAAKGEADRFINLHSGEWADAVSTIALTSLKLLKDKKNDTLPSTSDLVKLQRYQKEQINILTSQLSADPDQLTWRRLAEIILTRIIVFNKRRGGETSKLLVSSYTDRPNWREQGNEEMQQTLNDVEKQLLNRMDLIFIAGKRNRKVPILLTSDVKDAMDLLLNLRTQCGIEASNAYFFASASAHGHLSSWLVLNKVAIAAQLERPKLVTSTRLRKYIATVSQVIDLHENEKEWLCNHLGHELNIHVQHYKQHEPVIEMTKLSRLLLAIDLGNGYKFQGKRLEDISVEEIDVTARTSQARCLNDEVDSDDNQSDVDQQQGLDHNAPAIGEEIDAYDIVANGQPTGTADTGIETDPSERLHSAVNSCAKAFNAAAKQASIKRRIDSSTLLECPLVIKKKNPNIKASNKITSPMNKGMLSSKFIRNRIIDSDSDDDDGEFCQSAATKMSNSQTFASYESSSKDLGNGSETRVRRKWTDKELEFLKTFFKQSFKERKAPGYPAIRESQKHLQSLRNRTLAQIKSRLWDLIQKQ